MSKRVLLSIVGETTLHIWYVRETQWWHNQVLVDINKTGRKMDLSPGCASFVWRTHSVFSPSLTEWSKSSRGADAKLGGVAAKSVVQGLNKALPILIARWAQALIKGNLVKCTLCFAYYLLTAEDKSSPTDRADVYRTQSGGADLILCMTYLVQQSS